MQAKNTAKLLKQNGTTTDIVSAVIGVYNTDYKQVSELAATLRGNTDTETCQNIFDYLIENTRYVEDPVGVQWVKTPARLMADGTGDCKSMAIFIASCLRCLDIQHSFRFVSFNKKKEATHVYVVSSNIIIDPVVRINGLPKFNYETPFTYKADMSGTNIYYMAGIPRRNKSIGDLGSNIPISGSALRIIDQSLERLEAGYNANPSDYNLEQLNISKLLVHIATSTNLDAYLMSKGLWGIAFLSYKGVLSNTFESVKAEFDSIYYNQVSTSNIDNQLLSTLQNTILEQKKKIAGIAGDSSRERRIAEELNWASALYFFIHLYTEDEITEKFQNSTELLKKRKFVKIFINVFYDRQEWTESKLLNRCETLITSHFGMSIDKFKTVIESGKLNLPSIEQSILDATQKLENVFDIWFYVINDGLIDLNKEMVVKVNPFIPDKKEDQNNESNEDSKNDNSDGNDDKLPKKSNTTLILGALSALFLLR